jgi:hypothetical protein
MWQEHPCSAALTAVAKGVLAVYVSFVTQADSKNLKVGVHFGTTFCFLLVIGLVVHSINAESWNPATKVSRMEKKITLRLETVRCLYIQQVWAPTS